MPPELVQMEHADEAQYLYFLILSTPLPHEHTYHIIPESMRNLVVFSKSQASRCPSRARMTGTLKNNEKQGLQCCSSDASCLSIVIKR